MIVYIYQNDTNVKIGTIKNVVKIESKEESFLITNEEETVSVEKDNIKIVVYGF